MAGPLSNWGRWGSDDELGTLNHVSALDVTAAAALVRVGKVITLGRRIADPDGDPMWPGRHQPTKEMTRDKRSYERGEVQARPGNVEAADDRIHMDLQGTTHVDALGHMWTDDLLWNGYPADSTAGGLDEASAEAIAAHGIVARAVLADIPRHRGQEHLNPNDVITLDELEACLEAQHVALEGHEGLCLRTGYLDHHAPAVEETNREPGLAFGSDLVEWFAAREIAAFATDTLANEPLVDETTGRYFPLHIELMRNLGVPFLELCDFEELATACEEHQQCAFMFVAAPLRIVASSGSPVNPVAIL